MAMFKYVCLIKVFLLAAMGTALFYVGISRYEYGITDLNLQATDAFREALTIELTARNLKIDSLRMRNQIGASILGQEFITVTVDKGIGNEEYKIPTEKHQRNIVENAEMRILHSIALEEKPINPETLNAIWQQALRKSYLAGKTALCISITGEDKQSVSLKTTDYAEFDSTKPLFISNLGYLCEVEIVGCIAYSLWFVFYRYILLYTLLLSILCAVVYFSVVYVLKLLHRSPVIKEVIVPQLVIGLPKGESRIYQLTERLVFDAEQGLLILDKQVSQKLILQVCTLLEMLLNAEEYKLSDEVIMERLWIDSLGTCDKLRKVVSRLRLALKVDPSVDLKRVHSSSYQLIFDAA